MPCRATEQTEARSAGVATGTICRQAWALLAEPVADRDALVAFCLAAVTNPEAADGHA